MFNLEQWRQIWLSLGASNEAIPATLYDDIISAYRESHRFYHNLQHLSECLHKLNELRDLAEHPAAIELALWFHDAIYDPTRDDNEPLSAAWAMAVIRQAGLNEEIACNVHNLILATRHNSIPIDIDTKVLIDADLAILGATTDRYHEYEQQIRQEYAFVPEALFKEKRRALLQQFIAQPTIYHTERFIARYEQQARLNLTQALTEL